jgi:serine/threonine protein kinase
MYPLAPYNLAQYLQEVSDYNSGDRKLHKTRTKTLLTALGCLSSALFYLHVTQVIKHKDIKPENVLVDRHGSMLLADFGISKKYQGDTATSGPTPFTEKYAAPEVAAQHNRDLSADVFSLGCVFLEMTTMILGESLKTLDKEVFDGTSGDSWPKKAYRECIPTVEIWMSHLKGISLREGSPWDGHPYSSLSESRASQYEQTAGKHSLQERYLDIILAMMSERPYERLSMQDLYHVFTEFAADCFECHDSVSFQSEWHNGSGTDAWTLESTACSAGKKYSFKEQQLDIHHLRANVPSAQVSQVVKRSRTGNSEDTAMIRKSKQVCGFTNRSAQQIIRQSDIGEVFIFYKSCPISSLVSETSNRQTSVASCGYVAKQCDRPSVAKDLASPQLVLDKHGGDDDSSEAETYYNDCDGEDLVADSASRKLWHRVESSVLALLERKYAEGLFNRCRSGESTSNRSTSNGPPSKRRPIGQGKLVALRRKGDHPDENDEEQDQYHEQDIEEKSDIPSQYRKLFACQYFQHDRDRCLNRSCSGPGWLALHRLK